TDRDLVAVDPLHHPHPEGAVPHRAADREPACGAGGVLPCAPDRRRSAGRWRGPRPRRRRGALIEGVVHEDLLLEAVVVAEIDLRLLPFDLVFVVDHVDPLWARGDP